MTQRQATTYMGIILTLLVAYGWGMEREIKKHAVIITEQDVVRYCLDSRREKRSAKEIGYYCTEMGGDEFMEKGFKPNYDKYPSDKMFLGSDNH